MIRQLLNRQFVLGRINELVGDTTQGRDVRRGSLGSTSVADTENDEPEGLEAALIAASRRGPEEYLLPQPTAEDRRRTLSGEPHRATAAVPLDEVSFFSRDAMTSIVQTVLEQYYEEREPELLQEDPDGTRRFLKAEEPVTSPRRAGGRFEITDPIWLSDPRWVKSKIAELWRLYRGKRPFEAEPTTFEGLKDNARLLLVGDWGTGLKRAQDVATEMKRILEEGKAQERQQHVVHLGDVYYSGWQSEYERRFLPYWPVSLDEDSDQIISWACNGNHDMYSGGYGYFDHLLADPRFARQKKSSYFSLENDHWQILALDTAWEDNALKDPQASWVKEKLENSSGRKTLLLSHHHLFSAYDALDTDSNEAEGTRVEEKLREVLDTGRIDAWFWGHEHRCVLYRPYKGVRYGRCIGHGGVPVYSDKVPLPDPGSYQYREYFDAGWEDWALCGFAVLDLEGPTIHVRYVDEFGRTHKEETIE